MTTTMQLIAKQTVGADGASSITFSNIPQTYTDLKLVYSARGADNTSYTYITFNGSSSGSAVVLYAETSSSPTSFSPAVIQPISGQNYPSTTANTFASNELYIPNYTASGVAKSISHDGSTENNSNSAYEAMSAGLTTTTSAISSITIKQGGSSDTGSFKEFSTFYLYGISNSTTTQASTVPYASGGDIISTDGSYWYHTFLYSGTFTPLKNLTCDYLVVAGGGGGGTGDISNNNSGGGGGAGGLRSTVTATGGGGSLETALSLTANTYYTATVGAGGAGATGRTVRGSNGSNSVFSTITATGGGGGGSNNLSPYTGANGGSGGGGAQNGAGGTGTTNQGYAGGTGYDNGGGGGGGAGAVGGNGNAGTTTGGAGGAGVTVSISGSSVTYAGGGGGNGVTGGAGGSGGGGAGAYNAAGTAGTANRGGGGGSGSLGASSTGAAAGGSGIIIVRYAV